jgi:pimeloyl-ACP methyl ester carboxylesterase
MVAHDLGGMVAWALATSHPQRLKSLTVLLTPHPIAFQESRKADPKQDRRLWGANDMALGEDAAMRTKDFVKAPYQFVRLAGYAHWLPNEGEPDLQPIILAHLWAYD